MLSSKNATTCCFNSIFSDDHNILYLSFLEILDLNRELLGSSQSH